MNLSRIPYNKSSLFLLCPLAIMLAALACSDPRGETSGGEAAAGAEHREAPGDGKPRRHDEHDDPNDHEEGVVELTPEAASRAGIRTATVEERVLEGELETTGQVDFDQTRLAHVSPRIAGRVHRVRALLGEAVRAGETLAEIDSIDLGRTKADYLQAKAKEELARKTFDRAQGLYADRIASEQEVLEAEAGWREATASMLTSEETLHLYGLSQAQVDALRYDDPKVSIHPLKAPFAGTVVEKHATLGELVTPEHSLFTLADLSRVWIWIDVYQRDLGRVHVGDEVKARVDAYPGEVFAGTVSYLSAQVDADTRTVRARLDASNPEGKLRPGMFVEVDLFDPHGADGREARSKSRVVPESAVVRDGDGTIVFVAAGERSFERRAVRVGRKAGGFVEILGEPGLDGLEPGASVVVEGAFLLKSAASKESMGEGDEH